MKTPNVRPLQMLENKFDTVLKNIKINKQSPLKIERGEWL